jgi:hypothetical protein
MRFGERAHIKYAKNFVEESKDKKTEWIRLKIPTLFFFRQYVWQI